MIDDLGFLTRIESDVFAEWRSRSRSLIYRTDPEAWLWDVLGKRWWSTQAEIAQSVVHNEFTLVKSCNGVGKDLALDTPLPTPTGWTTMADVRPGDMLLDEAGRPTRVLTKSQVFHKPSYRITFSDGASLVSSDTHEWNTLDRRARNRLRMRRGVTDWRDHWDESQTVDTAEISHTLGDRVRNHAIPINGALDLPDAALPIDPYILGAWLGDGDSSGAGMTVGTDGEYIVEEFALAGVELRSRVSDASGIRYEFARQGFVQAARTLELIGAKHVPAAYLRASIAQRRELLRGLMDTDGFSAKRGTCGIDLMSERLARGVVELIRSLGIRASITPARTYLDGRDVGTRYRIVFNSAWSPFTVGQYKDARFEPSVAQASRKTARTVVSVELVGSVPTQCVSVDSPRHLYLAGEHMIPTHNTQLAGDLVSWFACVHPPEETSILLSAPVREQIDTMMFRYLRENHFLASERGNPLIGHITKWPKWVIESPIRKDLVLPKRPADQNLVSSFQGIHDTHVMVGLDEAGGLPEDMFTAANAVTTNDHARILAIGNPDRLNTGFHERFKDRDKYSMWKTFTIGANDSPNFTGEMIYPDDPERDAWVKARLVKVSWAEMMRKSSPKGVVAAKVDGEFPDVDDTTWFPPDVIDKALETTIEPDETAPKWIGADLSYQGEDKSAMYLNWGGRIRRLDEWNRESGTEAIESARRIHNAAVMHGVTEVRVDMAGTGSGVYSNLKTLDEFKDRPYYVIGINGSNSTPNPNMWLNARAWHYWQMREAMIAGKIDLQFQGSVGDKDDLELRDEMQRQTYELTPRNQYKMTSKKDMKAAGIKSPDHLDAVIYSMIDTKPWLGGPAAGMKPGDTIVIDPFEIDKMELTGLPM